GTGGMKRSQADRQNGVDGKVSRHHVRQRFSVTVGTRSRSRSTCVDALFSGETNINTTARYTRRPANRTDGDVVRRSHRPQVKLRRREYSSWTAVGQPRGLRGELATCSGPLRARQPSSRAAAANSSSMRVRKRKKAGSRRTPPRGSC